LAYVRNALGGEIVGFSTSPPTDKHRVIRVVFWPPPGGFFIWRHNLQYHEPHRYDRASLLALLAALDASRRALCRDACGDWQIRGKDGHIYPSGDGYVAYVKAGSRGMFESGSVGITS
jgi:hypothetical protein